jgi:hypothetical protein
MTIQLTNPKSYIPGDTVSGTISVDPKFQKPMTSIQLSLTGRSKSKIIRKNGNSTSIYRGRAILFQQTRELTAANTEVNRQIDGGSVWAFEMEIPLKPAANIIGDPFEKTAGFPSNLDADDVAKAELPNIFYYKQHSALSGTRQEAYIEYWLEATSTAGKAIYPLFVRKKATEMPLQDQLPTTRPFGVEIASFKLLAEHQMGKLTFGQKSSQFFKTSKVPRYQFKVQLSVPQIWQLDHPEPMPMFLWLEPLVGTNNATIFDGTTSKLPPVKILSARVLLKSTCHTRAVKSLFSIPETSKTTKHFIGSHSFLNEPTQIPVTWNDSEESRTPSKTPFSPGSARSMPPPEAALPLGQLLKVQLHHKLSRFLGKPAYAAENNIYPTFTTYNVCLFYRLEVELRIECAEKTLKHSYSGPLTILAASEEQVRAREHELGEEGMKKNYHDLEAALDSTGMIVGGIVDVIGNFLGG